MNAETAAESVMGASRASFGSGLRAKAMKRARSFRSSQLFWPLVAWALILLLNFLFTEGFFQIVVREGHLYGTMIDIFDRSAPTMMLALGMTLVIATGGVDLSVGATTAVAGAWVAVSLQGGQSLPQAVAGGVGLSLLAGLWNGLLVAWLEVQPIVATLVLMVAGRGVAQLLTGGQIIPIENATFRFLGSGFFLGFPFSLTSVIAVFLATAFLARKTALGLLIESVGNSPLASRYAAIDSGRVKAAVYIFSGLCAGLAGLIIASDISAADANNAGQYLELDAILATVIGGTALTGGRFSLAGSALGALIIQTVSTTINTRGIAVEFTLVIKALVVLAVCLIQSDAFRARVGGIFRKKAAS